MNTCPVCEGMGEVKCATCGGSGRIAPFAPMAQGVILCPVCGGSGYVVCWNCNGSGEVDEEDSW
jgi:DnaJ-class molecular chaperone